MSIPSRLSGQQARVLDLMCEGFTNKEIARAMGISPRTVEIHRRHALRCIGARNTIHGVLLWDRVRRGGDVPTFIAYLANVASGVGWAAGVGASETAGLCISYLATHPQEIPAFMERGFSALGEGRCGINLYAEGCLSWRGMDGEIHAPEDLAA